MAAYVCFVAHTSERYADIFASSSLCDGSGYRGLSRAGRAHKTNDLTFKLGGELLYGNELQYSLLDPLESVVVGVEYLFCRLHICPLLGSFVPREIKAGFKICAYYICLGRAIRHFCQSVIFFKQFFRDFRGQVRRHYFIVKFLVFVVILAKLILDDAHLLSQIIFAALAI